VDPELYKYSDESADWIVKLNNFITTGEITDSTILHPGITNVLLFTRYYVLINQSTATLFNYL